MLTQSERLIVENQSIIGEAITNKGQFRLGPDQNGMDLEEIFLDVY